MKKPQNEDTIFSMKNNLSRSKNKSILNYPT